uniref:BZIP domain-containing protein n=1 Tax=Peronospora matthiolae TaxID=2874970 RepID=A0AAV1V9S4_9STRA
MNDCVHQSSQCKFLRNDELRGIVQRTNPSEGSPFFSHSGREMETDARYYDAPTIPFATYDEKTSFYFPNISEGKRDIRPAGGPSSQTSCTARRPVKDSGVATTSAVFLLPEKQRLRELRRTRQIRYRKKKEQYILNLEEQTRKLRRTIEDCEQYRRSKSDTMVTKMNAWSFAAEYFRLFRYGVRFKKELKASQTGPSDQLDFLRRSMAKDVAFNAEHDIDRMLWDWRQTSLWFSPVSLELDRLEKDAAGFLVATTLFTVSISEQTLYNVFPHLCNSNGTMSALALKLLGHTFTMPSSTHFKWDDTLGRLVSVVSQSDMLTPLLLHLGSLEDVSRVFDKALVTPDFQHVVKEQ